MNVKKYNKMLDSIVTPEVERLKKYEKIAIDVIHVLEDIKNKENWIKINAVSKIIQRNAILREGV